MNEDMITCFFFFLTQVASIRNPPSPPFELTQVKILAQIASQAKKLILGSTQKIQTMPWGNGSTLLFAKEEQKDLTEKAPSFVVNQTITSSISKEMRCADNLPKKAYTSSSSQSCNCLVNLRLQPPSSQRSLTQASLEVAMEYSLEISSWTNPTPLTLLELHLVPRPNLKPNSNLENLSSTSYSLPHHALLSLP